jgi:hypothetical protein
VTDAPPFYAVTQQDLPKLSLADAYVLRWRRRQGFPSSAEQLSLVEAFPSATPDELDHLHERVEDLGTRANRWCYQEWGRPGGVSYEAFLAGMMRVFPEFSSSAVDTVIDWSMFTNK